MLREIKSCHLNGTDSLAFVNHYPKSKFIRDSLYEHPVIILKIIRVYNHLKSTIAEHMISQPPEDRLIGGVDCIVEGIECTNLHLTDS